MNRYNFMPNDIIYELILNICDKYNYPSLLKNITDDLVIKRNFILSGKNFIKYIQILSMFSETYDYVINLIDSSFTDFKLQIKSEFYEYLIFRSILDKEYEKIKTYLETLNKRYISDYTNEKIRNNEIYRGNVHLINSFIDILNDYNETKSSNIKNKLNSNEDSLKKEEINNFINELIKSSKECNNNWISDHIFIKLIYKFYTEFSFNLDEIKNIIDDFSKSTKTDLILKDLINDGYKNISFKLLEFLKDNEEILVRKSFNIITNLLKIHSSKILAENKEFLLSDENNRRILNFLRNNTSIEVREAVKNYISAILEAKKFGTFNYLNFDSLRKLALNVYGDTKQISNLFEDFKVDL